jgi:Zinc finger, C3HC4 type (RING finger)
MSVEEVCCICLDLLADSTIQPCGHKLFCKSCILTTMELDNRCPYCRGDVRRIHCSGTLIFTWALDMAANSAITNYSIQSRLNTLALLDWYEFLTTIRGEEEELEKIFEAKDLVTNNWMVVRNRVQILLSRRNSVPVVDDEPFEFVVIN